MFYLLFFKGVVDHNPEKVGLRLCLDNLFNGQMAVADHIPEKECHNPGITSPLRTGYPGNGYDFRSLEGVDWINKLEVFGVCTLLVRK